MELDYLYWLILLLLFGRLLGELFRRFDFQPLIGEVLAGLILGPAIIGLTVTTINGVNPLEYFSQFGIIMLMLLAGLITDFESFAENKISSIVIGVLGMVICFVLLFIPMRFLFDMDPLPALFIAAIFSNTAIEVCAGIMMDSSNQRLKNVVMGASFVDDIIAVFLIGIVSPLVFNPDQTIQIADVVWLALMVIIFLIITLVALSWLVEKIFDRLHKGTEEYKWMLTSTFILTFILALTATWVGLHYVIGAYIAGLIVGKWGSKVGPLLRRRITWHKLVGDINPPLRAIFGPIFFGYIGLTVSVLIKGGENTIFGDIPAVSLVAVAPLILVLGFLVFAGKITGCGLGARLCNFNKNESVTIGTAMCGRGALELVLLSFGLEIGVITNNHFISLVIVTLITIIMTPILYTLAVRRNERKDKEQKGAVENEDQ
jgi:Kef-type K+ transport system membrane component KefB